MWNFRIGESLKHLIIYTCLPFYFWSCLLNEAGNMELEMVESFRSGIWGAITTGAMKWHRFFYIWAFHILNYVKMANKIVALNIRRTETWKMLLNFKPKRDLLGVDVVVQWVISWPVMPTYHMSECWFRSWPVFCQSGLLLTFLRRQQKMMTQIYR